MAFDLERIIRFAVIAEEQSFSRAAQRLNVDQPWLSRQIQQLEAQLGFTLLERTTRKVSLTPEGQALLAAAQELTGVADNVRNQIRAIQRQRERYIRVGLSSTSYWVRARQRVLDTFQTSNADAGLELIAGRTPALLAQLAEQELEVVIGSVSEGAEAFDRVLIYRGAPSLLVPDDHPLSRREVISMEDLRGHRMATTPRENNPRATDQLYQPFEEAGMELRPVPEGRVAMLHYARQEQLLLLNLQEPADRDFGVPNFVDRRLEGGRSLSETWVYRNPGDDRPLVRRFWAIVERYRFDGPAGMARERTA